MSQTASLPQVCRNHPEAPAEWVCLKCGHLFCDRCVVKIDRGKIKGYVCPACRDRCGRIAPPEETRRIPAPVHVARALAFPLRGSGKYILPIGAGVLMAGNYFLSEAISILRGLVTLTGGGGTAIVWAAIYGLLAMCVLGYLALYVISIIAGSAGSEEAPPNWPDVSGSDDAIRGFLLFVGAAAFSFLPAVAVKLWPGERGELAAVFWALIGLGMVYCPMGLLAVAMFDTLNALNPYKVVRGIVKAGPLYLLALPALPALYLLNRGPWKPDILSFLEGAASLYLLMLEARILGLLCRGRAEKLGWAEET